MGVLYVCPKLSNASHTKFPSHESVSYESQHTVVAAVAATTGACKGIDEFLQTDAKLAPDMTGRPTFALRCSYESKFIYKLCVPTITTGDVRPR